MATANGNYTGFADQPQTTVSNGGTDAPAGGTSEQWTVSSSASFPPASIGTYPNASQWFKVADTAATSEIIAVTAVTGTVWGVTRGAESTTPVTHASNFTIQQVVSAEDLGSMAQLQQNGQTVATTITSTSGFATLATYTPMPRDIPAGGVVYDFHVYGLLSNSTVTNHFTIGTYWGNSSTPITTMIANAAPGNGTVGPMTNGTFWIEGRVDCWGATTMACGMNMQGVSTVAAHSVVTMVGAGTATISGTAGPLMIMATVPSGTTIVTYGGSFFRIS